VWVRLARSTGPFSLGERREHEQVQTALLTRLFKLGSELRAATGPAAPVRRFSALVGRRFGRVVNDSQFRAFVPLREDGVVEPFAVEVGDVLHKGRD
jgi:hypothetical protein